MEALSFLKFWKPSIPVSPAIDVPSSCDLEFDEEDDSFFELELDLPYFEENPESKNNDPASKFKFSSRDSVLCEPTVSPSPSNLFSRRKVLPVDSQPNSRPQSPITLFKSSPKFRALRFKKSKSMPTPKVEKAEGTEYLHRTGSNLSTFSVDYSAENSLLDDDSVSKRFSKDVVQKYLKLVKPFNLKGSERDGYEVKFQRNFSRAAPSTLSTTAIARKYTGKVKPFPAANGGVSSPARMDDAQHHDSIQSAILHCKKSFHSARDSSMLSRSTSDAMLVS